MTARDYMGERGVSVRNARFVGDFVAVRTEPEKAVEMVSRAGFRTWRPPNRAKLYTLWTRGMSIEPYTDVWTMPYRGGWRYANVENARPEDFTGNFKTEAQALAEVARITKEESDRFDAQQQEQLAAMRAKA
jgi:hypothetical protein